MAKSMAEGSIRRVMLMMFCCISGVASEKANGIILCMKIKAITASPEINIMAPVSIVFAIWYACFLSFIKYCVKIGRNAAVNAPAIKRLNKRSGIRKEALYVSVAVVVPKFTARMRSLKSPIA